MQVLQSQHGQACGFHCLMAFLTAVSDERFFRSLGTSSQIFGPKRESDSVPCKTAQTGREKKVDLFLVLYTVMLFNLKQSLTSFGDKPLTHLYSSVARTCMFL